MKNYQIVYKLNGIDKVDVVSISDTNYLTKEEIEESVVYELKKRIGYHSSKDKIEINAVRIV